MCTAAHVFLQQWSSLVNKTYQWCVRVIVVRCVNKKNYINKCVFTECPNGQWKCKSGQCIPDRDYCNGYLDCIDNSDEENCPTIPPYYTTTYSPYTRPPTRPPITPQAPVYTTTFLPNRPTFPEGKISLIYSFGFTKSWRYFQFKSVHGSGIFQ